MGVLSLNVNLTSAQDMGGGWQRGSQGVPNFGVVPTKPEETEVDQAVDQEGEDGGDEPEEAVLEVEIEGQPRPPVIGKPIKNPTRPLKVSSGVGSALIRRPIKPRTRGGKKVYTVKRRKSYRIIT